MALGSDLPEELLIIILSWLPALSVIRFKCVCKSWCSLFQNHTFIVKHLINSKNNNTDGSLFHKRMDNDNYRKQTYSLLSYETLEVTANLDFPYLKDETVHPMRTVGCCDGIICIYCLYRAGVVLWNPATHEIKMLPPSLIPTPNNKSESPLGGPLGFGYDSKSTDYKVVHLVELHHVLHPNYYHIEVYGLRTDCWRKSDAFLPHSVSANSFGQLVPYVDGRFSWLGLNEFRREIIVTFDLSDEIIIVTPLPEYCDLDKVRDYWTSLTVLNDSVALITNPRNPRRDNVMCEVWVLNEHGVKESWSKLYTFGPVLELRHPSGFWKNGFLFIETFNSGVTLINTCTLEMKDLPFDNSILNRFVYYTESLIPLNGCSISALLS